MPGKSKINFELALENQVWGAKRDALGDIREGDSIVFVFGGKGNVRQRPTGAERVVFTRAIGAPYFEEASFGWIDGVFPFRVKFELDKERLELVGVKLPCAALPSTYVEAIRVSSCKQSAPVGVGRLESAFDEERSKLEARIDLELDRGRRPLNPERLGRDDPEAKKREAFVFERDPRVVAETLHRAEFKCEVHGCSAPVFLRAKDGRPYVEVHHLERLADGGRDRLSNTVCLCPSHHREIHLGADCAGLTEELLNLRADSKGE